MYCDAKVTGIVKIRAINPLSSPTTVSCSIVLELFRKKEGLNGQIDSVIPLTWCAGFVEDYICDEVDFIILPQKGFVPMRLYHS